MLVKVGCFRNHCALKGGFLKPQKPPLNTPLELINNNINILTNPPLGTGTWKLHHSMSLSVLETL